MNKDSPSLDEEDDARDFCEELRSFIEIHEVRGCSRKRIGQAMIGFGVSKLNEVCPSTEEVIKITEKTINVWLSPDNE